MVDLSNSASERLRDLFTHMRTKSQLVLGIMSGTSLDGVDYALCRIGAEELRLMKLWSAPFPKVLRQRLHAAACGQAGSWELAQLHHDLGRFYAAKSLSGLGGLSPNCVGLHGQTVFHNPSRKAPATLQIGEPAYLAGTLRVPVVSNFRAGDIAVGGQGAPLATAFHVRAFGERGRHVCVNNLGGISNVTSIDWRRGASPKLLSFDTGPANVLMDLAARMYSAGRTACDAGGRLARRGVVQDSVVDRWLKHPFFRLPPPKSTGREVFGEVFLKRAIADAGRARLRPADLLATLAAFTARSLAMNYRLHLPAAPDLVVLSGGGAANPVLVGMIRGQVSISNRKAKVVVSEELGWPKESVEAAAFALLGWLRLRRQTGCEPQVTGAKETAVLGQVTDLG